MRKNYYNGWLDPLIRSMFEAGLNPNQIYLKLREDFKDTPNQKLPSRGTIYNYCANYNQETLDEHESMIIWQKLERILARRWQKRKNNVRV